MMEHNPFSKERYTELLGIVDKISYFLTFLKEDPAFYLTVKKLYATSLRDWEKKVNHFVLCDVVKCYDEMGHSINFDSAEGVGVQVLTARLFGFPHCPYDEVDRLKERLPIDTEKLIINTSLVFEDIDIPWDKFLLGSILEKYTNDSLKYYHRLLHEYLLIIAGVDETVSEAEEQWLKNLLSWAERDSEALYSADLQPYHTDMELKKYDPLISDAAWLAVEEGYVSKELLREQFGIRRLRARRIVRLLQEIGIVKDGRRGEFDTVCPDMETLILIMSKVYKRSKNGLDVSFVDDEDGDWDELLRDVATFVVRHGQCSIALVQRKFNIGFHRAGRIIDQMAILGIIQSYGHRGFREVIMKNVDSMEKRLENKEEFARQKAEFRMRMGGVFSVWDRKMEE